MWQELQLAGGWFGALNIFNLVFIPMCHRLRRDEHENGCISTLLRTNVSHISAARIAKVNQRISLVLGCLLATRLLFHCVSTVDIWETSEWDEKVSRV